MLSPIKWGALALSVTILAGCGVKQEATSVILDRTEGAFLSRLHGNLSNQHAEVLADIALDHLGEEFFGPMNIGGAYKARFTTTRGTPSSELVEKFYNYVYGYPVTLRAIDTHREDVYTNYFEALDEMVFADHHNDVQEEIYQGMVTESYRMLRTMRNYRIVTGDWYDYSTIGDPFARFVAIIDYEHGEMLVLEQGYVD